MDAVALIRRLHQHRAWVNANLIAAAETLSDENLRRMFPIGQGSIWKSLLHLFAAEYVWLATLHGDESPVAPGDLPNRLPGNQLGEKPIPDLPQLKKLWMELEGRWTQSLEELTSEQLDEQAPKWVSQSGKRTRISTSRSDIHLHVCTHAHYTTAQVVNMLKQTGAASLPEVMMITLARSEAAAAE